MENNNCTDCYSCDCWDADREGCTMSSVDRNYACPIECDDEIWTYNHFFLPMIPPTVTAQEHKITVRNGKPIFYDPPEVKQAREKLISHLARFAPEKPFNCGVRLAVKWCFPKGSHKDGEYRTTKPDTDNLQKLLKDCMTTCGFWTDDCLVASEICEKFWADIPGIFISIEPLEVHNED